MTALWVTEAAEGFWSAAGGAAEEFPRDLRRAVALALPLAVVDLPRLRTGGIRAWLEQRGVRLPVTSQDRAVRACLLVRDGHGLVFLDGADPADERRFSLAHEVAHYLVEYALPRERAVARLGPAALAAQDGRRRPSVDERVDGLLARVPLRLRLHFMERTADGHPADVGTSAAEQRADALALELLAPAAAVRAHASGRSTDEATLRAAFGLSPGVARAYARQLEGPAATSSLAQRLGLAP